MPWFHQLVTSSCSLLSGAARAATARRPSFRQVLRLLLARYKRWLAEDLWFERIYCFPAGMPGAAYHVCQHYFYFALYCMYFAANFMVWGLRVVDIGL